MYEVMGRARRATRVLVSGGGPTADWNAVAVAKTGTEVDAVARPTAPKDPALVAEKSRLESHGANALAYEKNRLRDIGHFSESMLDRNAGADGAMAQPNVHRHGKEITLVTPSEEMTTGTFAGRPGKVHVRFSDGSEDWYDYIVISHGQDATLPGGAVAITEGIPMKLADAEGLPYIESTDGSVRVLGAASFSSAWERRLSLEDAQDWASLRDRRVEELPPFSQGIAPSIHMAGQQISAANNKSNQ